jgi:nucleosome binding factor SPN SPT16 subunit
MHVGKKRIQGVLEAHANGFLYTSRKNEKVMINYNRIKHAFFQVCRMFPTKKSAQVNFDLFSQQPCEDEVVILFHFHLKHGIMIGKKQVGGFFCFA